MTKKEYEEKRTALLDELEKADTSEKVDELRNKIVDLKKETIEEDTTKEDITKEEERNLMKKTVAEKEQKNLVKVNLNKEDKEMEEKKSLADVLKSTEYRTAWAKKLMGIKLEEKEERALGDAITTTDTTFVQSTADTQGVNNGGLFIPESVRLDILQIINKQSPFLNAVRKIAVAANVDFPYEDAADDSKWYTELTSTENAGEKYNQLSLTGYELARQVVVTWKLEKMAVEQFITFITQELADKMGRALAYHVLYGDGSKKITGALNGLVAVSGTNVIDAILKAYKALDEEKRIGAKAYISSDLAIDLVGYQDKNGNYPYLQGLAGTDIVSIETDPYLKAEDILVGNPNNYILNTVEGISITKEVQVTPRKNVYAAYAIYDGKPIPNAFVKGAVSTTPSL